MNKKKKIAYVINHLSFFTSHILPLADEAIKRGFKIHIFCGKGGSQSMENEALKIIKLKNFNISNFNFEPGIGNFFFEIFNLVKMIYYIKKFNPDIIHGISLKGVIFSCFYSLIFKPKKKIFFITGMGHFFTNHLNIVEKIIKNIILKIIRLTLKTDKSLLVIENTHDFNFFTKKEKINKSKILKLSGVGVNLKKFNYLEKKKKKLVIFPARVLKEKGIFEFYSAAIYLSRKFDNWKFVIAGTLDYKKNKKNLELDSLKNTKNIKFLGHVNKIHNLFNIASIACLPSYREGFPKSLIEACASGCAIITTNVPGCRDSVKKNKNAFLVPPRNIAILKKKLEKLINNKSLRIKFSKYSRKIAKKNYQLKIFINKNIKEYQAE